MPATRDNTYPPIATSTDSRSVAPGKRVDPPHHLATTSTFDSAGDQVRPESAIADETDPSLALDPLPQISAGQHSAEQLERHARELAIWLARRQQELDRREQQLHQQIAQFEQQQRAARLWCDEHTDEAHQRLAQAAEAERLLTERAQAIDQQQDQLHQLERQLDAQRVQLEDQRTSLALEAARHQQRHEELAARGAELQRDLLRARQQIDTDRLAALATIRQALTQVEQRRAEAERLAAEAEQRASRPSPHQQQLAQQLDQRQRDLERSEAALAEEHGQLVQLRLHLEQQREEQARDARWAEEKLARRQQQLEAEFDSQRAALARQSEQLDRRHAALRQSQAELERLHAETLADRLATEELRSQMSAAVPPAALAQAQAALRARLDDQYRLAADRLAEQRAQLVALRQELADDLRRLEQRHQQLAAWADEQRQHAARQTAQWAAQAETLDTARAELEHQRSAWQCERAELQHQLRRLQAELRRAGGPTARLG